MAAFTCDIEGSRVRDEYKCTGEVERENHDLLDDAGRPPMGALGGDAIRFSSAPALGGDGIVIEAVSLGTRGARVTVVGLYGHESFGWQVEDKLRFNLSPSAYRRLAGRVDAALAQPVGSRYRDEDGQVFEAMCVDGPGYLTERGIHGSVINFAGSCTDLHPNRLVARAMFGLLCPHLDVDFPALPVLVRACRGHSRKPAYELVGE